MTIQVKEIGIPLGVDKGTFINTIYINGQLQLKQIDETENLEPIYEKSGSWESDPIDLVDKFLVYDNIVLIKNVFSKDSYKIFTRTSDNNIDYDEYLPISLDGTIQSTPKRFIQIKINFEAGFLTNEFFISHFNDSSTIQEWSNVDFVEIDNEVLKLKREYQFVMSNDTNWLNEGNLFRKTISNMDFMKIDSLKTY